MIPRTHDPLRELQRAAEAYALSISVERDREHAEKMQALQADLAGSRRENARLREQLAEQSKAHSREIEDLRHRHQVELALDSMSDGMTT